MENPILWSGFPVNTFSATGCTTCSLFLTTGVVPDPCHEMASGGASGGGVTFTYSIPTLFDAMFFKINRHKNC